MASISSKKKKDGSVSYRAEICKKENGQIVHREAKSFSKKRLAVEWARRREVALETPEGIKKLRNHGITVADIIQWYINEYEEVQDFGRSKRHDLRRLMGYEFARIQANHLEPMDLIAHIKERRKECGPATAKNDLVWLRTVLKSARPHFPSLNISLSVVDDASQYCYDNRLIAASNRRERRPTASEIEVLDAYLASRESRAEIPIHTLFWFAVYSCRRQNEITNLLWADNDPKTQTGMVRDIKHPRDKNKSRVFKYTNEAWEIVQRQPKTDFRIFPYNARSVSAAFANSCKACGLDNLRFHDLRHEGASRLFEAGYSIIEVQQFTLHESWDVLRRYTNLQPGKVILR